MTSGQRMILLLISGIMTMSVSADALAQSSDKPITLSGTIAFLRERNIWLMNADGSDQRRWKTLDNIFGNLSWAPDGKRVLFTRRGEYSYSLPDGGGGSHRLYDVFASHIDSTAENFWWWITLNRGSRTPEWSRDGKYILYTRDVNANIIDAELPDYKIEYRNFNGSEIVALTRVGAKPRECQGSEPTWSPDGKRIAFIYQKAKDPTGAGGSALEAVGLVIVPSEGIVRTDQELEVAAREIPSVSGPVWSPDGKWICYVSDRTKDGGIYLVSPDGTTNKRIFEKTSRIIPFRGKASWSSDSEWITFASTDGFIYLLKADGTSAPRRITSNGNDYNPAFAPK